jgi:hypothetical protein
MQVTTQFRSIRSCVVRTLALAGLLAAVSGVGAQERPMGQLDGACAGDCTARGYASEYCAQVCWVPDRPRGRPDEVTDWSCMTACSEQGGKYGECKPRCRLR